MSLFLPVLRPICNLSFSDDDNIFWSCKKTCCRFRRALWLCIYSVLQIQHKVFGVCTSFECVLVECYLWRDLSAQSGLELFFVCHCCVFVCVRICFIKTAQVINSYVQTCNTFTLYEYDYVHVDQFSCATASISQGWLTTGCVHVNYVVFQF